MTGKNKLLMFVILIFVILVGIAFFWAYSVTSDMKKALTKPNARGEEISVDDLTLTETRDGNKYWEMYAKSGFYDNKSNYVKLSEVKGNFYKKGKVIMSFAAPAGTYNDKSKEIKLTGGSKVATDDKVLISAKELNWQGSNDHITAKGNVIIRRSNEFITHSDSSEFNTDFSKFKIIGNSKTKIFRKS